MLKSLEKIYGLKRSNSKYDGLVCTFDLDKTYLDTRFESLRKLVRIPFEKAEEKKNIPGVAAVVRELRRSPRRVAPAGTDLFYFRFARGHAQGCDREAET